MPTPLSSLYSSPLWMQDNQRYLADALADVKDCLTQRLHLGAEETPPDAAPATDLSSSSPRRSRRSPHAPASDLPPSALEMLCAAFELSPFERGILLLCAGMELDSQFAGLCAEAQGSPQNSGPTFGLALACLPQPYWSALAPDAPLRHWRLIELVGQNGLINSPLRIDERILHYLTGMSGMDARLRPLLRPVSCEDELTPSQQGIAAQIATAWQHNAIPSLLPLVHLCGSETATKLALAASACAQTGRELYLLPQAALPATIAELETLMQLWEREARLADLALLLDCEEQDGNGAAHADAITWLTDRIHSPLLLATVERRPMRHRSLLTFEVGRPTLAEQQALWKAALTASSLPFGPIKDVDLDKQIARLTAQFDVSASTIRAVCLAAEIGVASETTPAFSLAAVWDACRSHARPRLDDLTQRIEATSRAEDLILPEPQRLILQNIVAHVRQRNQVYQEWGFAGRGARGLGITALFAGPSGTGKTTAAEALSGELGLDLYRIDLSAVVSKYIGESEKNLRRVFDAAEEGGAVLLFDEADALFGKRSEVKDSHDRHANLEVSYLLQRMETYRGLAILTTNLQTALDTAFLRRIRFIVQFPFPDAAHRQEIWKRVFPPQTPTQGLDIRLLAQLDVSGGTIRNIALNAAFGAADRGEIVQMKHVLSAAKVEYAKLNKSLTSAETNGWLTEG